MRAARWICLTLLVGVCAISFAGDIQVSCDPGLQVFLDDELMGTSSSREDGLFLMDVPRGTHVVRIEKTGFVPQVFEIEISTLPVEIKVQEFIPVQPTPREEPVAPVAVKKAAGNLIVTSAPQNCVVEIDGRAEDKTSPYLSFDGLAAGKHTISFSKDGFEPISGVVEVRSGAEITVRGNLRDGKVEVLHEGKGSLRVLSKPKVCTVFFNGEARAKTTQHLNITRIPAGEYTLVAKWRHLQVSSKVLIRDSEKTIVRVSFFEGDEPVDISYRTE